MSNYKERISELFKLKSFPYNSTHCVNDLLGNKKIILYGAGDGFITFSMFVLRKYGLKPYAVLDRKFKYGDKYQGIPAFSPLEYRPTNEEKENAVVIITVGKKEYHEEIVDCLCRLGFMNILFAHEIYEYHLHYTPSEVQKKGFDYYLENKEKIVACLDLLADDLSRQVFICFIQTHMLRKPIAIPSRPLEEQYFPADINLSKGFSRFINCGAYNGDTVMRLNSFCGKVEAIACFKPSPANFQLLTQYLLAKHNDIAENVIALPCAVYNQETQLHFTDGNKINSHISDKGQYIVQCVAMDHVIPCFRPTFISMDVEGAELEALKGALMLIRGNRPDLAISVYHSINHIWDIPLYIESLHLGYKFFLRNYTGFPSETVLYATT